MASLWMVEQVIEGGSPEEAPGWGWAGREEGILRAGEDVSLLPARK